MSPMLATLMPYLIAALILMALAYLKTIFE